MLKNIFYCVQQYSLIDEDLFNLILEEMQKYKGHNELRLAELDT